MEQLKKLLEAIPSKQRWTILISTLLVGAGLFAFARWQKEAGFRPLFQALAPEDAAGIVQKLKETGVEYRIAENGSSVSVPSDRVAELRLEMAGQGLPKSGRIGFELFDKTNFGATEFTEHVNYRRALEGELERSIISMNEVEQARVHITFAKDSVFVESRQAAKASVLLRLRSGVKLGPQSVLSITHLVSSAVEGLGPESISVLDMRGNLLSRPRRASSNDGMEPPDLSLEFQQQLERNLLLKITSTLDPLLGSEKFRAAVSAECDFTSGEQSEETFDPNKSVMVTSQKIDDSNGSSPVTSGIPGTQSNLPLSEASATKEKLSSSRRTESVSYQTSRTVRRLRLPQGAIKRLSVSVLIDQGVRWEKQDKQMQAVLVPPTPEKVKMIRDLVAGVVGFNQTRGDQLTVETLPFETTLNAEFPSSNAAPVVPAPPTQSPLEKLGLKKNTVIGSGIVALLLMVGCLVFVFSRRKRKPASGPAPVSAPVLPTPPEKKQAVTGGAELLPDHGRQRQLQVGDTELMALVSQVREAARKDTDLYAEVLQTWVVEEKAR